MNDYSINLLYCINFITIMVSPGSILLKNPPEDLKILILDKQTEMKKKNTSRKQVSKEAAVYALLKTCPEYNKTNA